MVSRHEIGVLVQRLRHTVLNVEVLVGAFNQEKDLVGAFSVIVKTDRETDGSFAALESGHWVRQQSYLGPGCNFASMAADGRIFTRKWNAAKWVYLIFAVGCSCRPESHHFTVQWISSVKLSGFRQCNIVSRGPTGGVLLSTARFCAIIMKVTKIE